MKSIAVTALLLIVAASVAVVEARGWRNNTRLPTQVRTNIGAVVCGGIAFFGGGRTSMSGNTRSGRVDIYNPSGTPAWTAAQMNTGRDLYGITCLDDYQVIFAGGIDSSGAVSNVIEKYKFSTSNWDMTHVLSVARSNPATVSIGFSVWMVGGMAAGGVSNVIDVYNIQGNDIVSSTLRVGRDMMVGVTLGNRAIFAGGWSAGDMASDVVDIFNTQTGNWTNATLSAPRSGLAGVCAYNKCVFAGGTDSAGVGSYIIDIWDLTNAGPTGAGVWRNALMMSYYNMNRDAWAVALPVVGTPNAFIVYLGTDSRSVQMIDLNAEQISTAENVLSIQRWGVSRAALRIGTTIMIAGGSDYLGRVTGLIEIYESSYCFADDGSPICRNGGVCTNSVSSFSCACVGGWTGTTCTLPPSSTASAGPAGPCLSFPCQNGGTCSSSVDQTTFTCVCPQSASGTLCQTLNAGVAHSASFVVLMTAAVLAFVGGCTAF